MTLRREDDIAELNRLRNEVETLRRENAKIPAYRMVERERNEAMRLFESIVTVDFGMSLSQLIAEQHDRWKKDQIVIAELAAVAKAAEEYAEHEHMIGDDLREPDPECCGESYNCARYEALLASRKALSPEARKLIGGEK